MTISNDTKFLLIVNAEAVISVDKFFFLFTSHEIPNSHSYL